MADDCGVGRGRLRRVFLSTGAVVAGALWCLSTTLTTTDGSPSAPGSDGYILLDDSDRVLDANERARELLSSVDLDSGTALPSVIPAVEPLLSPAGPDRTTVDDAVTATVESLGGGAEQYRLVVLSDSADFLELVPDYSLILDGSGTVTFADPTLGSELDCPPGALVGSQLEDEIHPEEAAELRQVFKQLLADPETKQRFEFRIRTNTGEWRVLEAAGENLLDSPAVGGILFTCRDVTERKQRENILREQKQRLEEFAEIVSHDLRSPLQVATGHLEHAAETGSEAAFQKVRRAHDRINTIIGDVLTLARQGTNAKETEPLSVEAVARDAWATVDTKGMTLDIRADTEIDADPDRLQQLFENLFRNAVEHAGEHATVTVGPIDPMPTSTRIGDPLRTGFYVADDGPGISDAHKKTALDSGFTTEADGTGFGLAIVEQIAEAHQWNVAVTDSRDGGARFEFTKQSADEILKPN